MPRPVAGTPVTQGDTNASTPTVVAFVTGAGETYLLVWVGVVGVFLGTVASVAFGAHSLSKLEGDTDTGILGELWGGVVPESTSDDVTVTYAGSSANATVAVVAFSGVETVGTPKKDLETSGTTSGITFEVDETGADTLIVDGIVTHFSDGDPAPAGSALYASFQDGASQCKQEGSYNDGGGSALTWSSVSHSNKSSIQVGVPLIGGAGGGEEGGVSSGLINSQALVGGLC